MFRRTACIDFTLHQTTEAGLYIGNELVVDNDGLHGPTEAMGPIMLEKGFHPIRVDYFQGTGGVDFEVAYSGPGIDKQPIPSQILSH